MHKIGYLFSLMAILALLLAACSPDDTAPAPGAPADPAPGVPETGQDELMQIGQNVYAAQCATCHMQDGSGEGALYPPLDGNQAVLGDSQPVIDVVLHGRGAMPAFEGVLTDQEVAGVVTYIRNAWTNDASPVTEQDVQELR